MRHFGRIALTLIFGFAASASLAASADDFKAAYAKAEAAEKQAVQMKTSWTTTVAAMEDAKKAADAGKFDDAVKLAQEAEALANASMAQAKDEQAHWQDAVIH
jgi:hypothetical protein